MADAPALVSFLHNVMPREIKRKGDAGQVKWEIDVFAQR